VQFTGEQVALICSIVIAVCAVGALVVSAVRGRLDSVKAEKEVAVSEREMVLSERAQANDDAETTLKLLREQIDILRQHRDEREAEIKAERQDWRDREKKLETRVLSVESRMKEAEKDYRTLVQTVTTMAFCANANTCGNYNPGDRRAIVVVGGSDSPETEEQGGAR
jgi:peptidoglycan hydrolase CwlO-like protein